ncbi:MAG: hypothetical protein OXH57_00690 [Ekhidna sp.]|nr:hypothetical protein [Ekhidna sp.]
MTAQEYKSLIEAGISESAVMVPSDLLDRKEEERATKEYLRMTELRLQKEIQEIKLSVEKEITEVRRDLKISELSLEKKMEEIKSSITLRMMFFFSPIYIALIMYIVKSFLGT